MTKNTKDLAGICPQKIYIKIKREFVQNLPNNIKDLAGICPKYSLIAGICPKYSLMNRPSEDLSGFCPKVFTNE